MNLLAPIRRLLLSLAIMSALVSVDARADIYGFVDEQGTGHFATEKLDPRYKLYVRGNATFDSSKFSPHPGDRSAASDLNVTRTPLYRNLSQHPGLKKFETFVNQAAKEFALEPALLKAVMAAESGFNPTAVSPKGAVGLMQIMPDTAERYGVTGDQKKSIQQKLTDPRTNIRLGARYLRDLLLMFPFKQDLVIASYNAGEGAVRKYKNQIPPFPETRNYVQVVAQFYQLYRPAQQREIKREATLEASPEAQFDTTSRVANASQGGARSARRPRIHLVIPGRRALPDAVQSIIE
ncbi:lytic transglycosylase domain-containing protein [Glaciimonas immobilis]|uniref:Soluble lytic murein transglycosylase-like protein n=1 Tax=Glaciimonas immobilis TaxID=728004 RepID=A0A840RQA1_9BURK|nr:lytic transglycosylase domain-containing protein [Glaciimonas immobilis]KAF3999310.1 lytic transglycosylase domain-containing protein [Glaciimonas immobilis]MBB5198791.1 soluble lytic murein transglycosylase-like protein [Glaciimonas immobilis]